MNKANDQGKFASNYTMISDMNIVQKQENYYGSDVCVCGYCKLVLDRKLYIFSTKVKKKASTEGTDRSFYSMLITYIQIRNSGHKVMCASICACTEKLCRYK